MKHTKLIHHWSGTAALLVLCLALGIGVWAQGRAARLSDSLVRLHVIAVSNEETEQEIKLRVRDAVLETLSPRLSGLTDPRQARSTIAANLDAVEAAARSAAEGRPVTVTLGQEHYPTRKYGSFALPAGEYCSLRVTLGDGGGRNWWCVVFPPLCMTAAQPAAAETAGMHKQDAALISGYDGDYIIGFRTLELWDQLQQHLQKDTD